MKEHYVSFEQAQALKRLGFDWKCNNYHCNEGDSPTFIYPPRNFNSQCDLMCSAPALHIAQKYLRDKGIHILVFPRQQCFYENQVLCHTKRFWNFDLMQIKDGWKPYGSLVEYDTYELALSAGIDKALELLTNKH